MKRLVCILFFVLIVNAIAFGASVYFTGAAAAVAQVDTFTPNDINIADIFTLTATGWDGSSASVSFTATAREVNNVTAGLAAAWNASTSTLMTVITALDTNALVQLTADTAGVAFMVAGSTTDGDGNDVQTLTKASVTKNSGPKDWNCPTNWSGGAVPGASASQDVYIQDAEILYGLDQNSTAETLTNLNILRTVIGTNPASGYLPVYLQINATTVNIGLHTGTGTSTELAPINLNTLATASTINVYNTGTNSTSTMPAVRIKSGSASTVLNVRKGDVGIACESGETATIGIINVMYNTNQQSDADVEIGSGVTLTTLNKTGGDCTLRCAATNVNCDYGDLYTEGSGAITTATIRGGKLIGNSSGTITTLNIIEDGAADFSKSNTARTITTPKVGGNGKIKYDPSVLTLTNKIQHYDTAGIVEIGSL